MRIASSEVVLNTAYTRRELFSRTERLEVRTASPSAATRQSRDQTRRPEAAPEPPTPAPDPSGDASMTTLADRTLLLLKILVEKLTGRPIRILHRSDLGGGNGSSAGCCNGTVRTGAAVSSPELGWGLRYDLREMHEEDQEIRFTASGLVRTTDGAELRFSLAVAATFRTVVETGVSLRAGNTQLFDPLVINFDGLAAELSDMSFSFDLDADGILETPRFPKPGAGFLVFDRNDNGQADDGRELFGPTTGNGFAELAVLDSDANGWLDEADLSFGKILVWTASADGTHTYRTLAQCNVGALFTGGVAARFSLQSVDGSRGGELRACGIYLTRRTDDSVVPGALQQIDLCA